MTSRKTKYRPAKRRGRSFRRSIRERPRFGERLARFFRFFLWFLLILSFLSISSLFGYQFYIFAFHSDYFLLEEVQITDVDEKLRRELISLAGVEPEKQLNVLQLRTDQLERKMRQHPRIKDIKVRKRLPGVLSIRVKERQPIAIVSCKEIYLIDSERIVLGVLQPEKTEAYNLPFITGISAPEISLGKPITSPALKKVVQTLLYLEQANLSLSYRFSEFSISPDEEITAILRGGLEVRFGQEPPLKRMASLETFLKDRDHPAKAIEYVDLRFNRQIVYLPKGAVSSGPQ